MRHLLLVLLLAAPLVGHAQDRVHARDLDGTWQLVFEVDTSEADNAFERIIMKSVSGLLDEIEVRFRFEDDDVLLVESGAFGDTDRDESTWTINRHGGLIFGSDGPVDVEDTVWYRDGNRLVAYESERGGKPGDAKGIYLRRLGR